MENTVEHFTLEQVREQAKDNFYGGVQFIFSPSELHALINACCNERIGAPVAFVDINAPCGIALTEEGAKLPVGAKLYKLQEQKP